MTERHDLDEARFFLDEAADAWRKGEDKEARTAAMIGFGYSQLAHSERVVAWRAEDRELEEKRHQYLVQQHERLLAAREHVVDIDTQERT